MQINATPDQTTPPPIILMGATVATNNLGVRALCSSLVGLFSELTPNTPIELLLAHNQSGATQIRIGPQTRQCRIHAFRMRPSIKALRSNIILVFLSACAFRLTPVPAIRRWLATLVPFISIVRNARLVGDIRGGDSFSDIYGLFRYLIGSLLPVSAILSGVKIVQFPQTYGPYKTTTARLIARWILRRSEIVMARDKASLSAAREIVGSHPKLVLSPDVAFSLTPCTPPAITTHPALSGDIPRGIIGLNINALMYYGGYSRRNMFSLQLDYAAFLPRLVEHLLNLTESEIWLVPHTFAPAGSIQSDPDVSLKLRNELPPEMQSRVRVVTGSYDAHEIKSVIGLCDFFIGSRMHSCIGALSQGVPCVGIAYSLKFRGVFETVNQHDAVIDGQSDDADTALIKIQQLYARRDQIRAQLTQSAREAKCRLSEVFDTTYLELRPTNSIPTATI